MKKLNLKCKKKMRRIIVVIFALSVLPTLCFAQTDDIIKLIDKGEFSKAKSLAGKAFAQDTNTDDYYYIMYNYYINKDNAERDSLIAYHYLVEYNKVAKKKTETSALAKEVLANVYQSKSIDRFNRYIELTQDLPDLNKEAKRIRNQLAYDRLQENQSIEEYKKFIDSYPDAPQREDALVWLNEHLLEYYIQQGNIDSLKSFAATTSSDTYKSKALSEIDRLSFSKALKLNTIDSYMNYIKEFPEGDYVRMARTNIEKVQYEQYVAQGSITDMLFYLNNTTSSDKNYKEVIDKLTFTATEHYSLIAMQKIQEIKPDENLLKQFAKRYVSDLDLHHINMLIETFPSLAENNDVAEAKSKAEILEALKNKPKLTLEDYKKNKNLFKNLNAHTSAKIFETFEELNFQQPKNKAVNFGLNSDYSYLQFKNAQNMEMNFVLTEKNGEIKTGHNDVKIFALADTNGYGWFAGTTNRDIFVSLLENGQWSEPFVLPSMINSRYDECNPVLSKDKKTLFFSSDRGFNFGKKDIYVSFRQDVNDWESWSEPVLLSEDFNTKDNDYVVALSDNMIVISQDDGFKEENNIYLEGKTDFEWVTGKIDTKNLTSPQLTAILIYDKQTLALKNIIHPNEKGFFAFLKPEKNVVMNCHRRNYFSPISDNNPQMYNIEQMVTKQNLVTLHSPFDESGNITQIGKKNLGLLANGFKNTPYILTISVHAVKPAQKLDAKALSDKQAIQIADILVKEGMSKENVVVIGYGEENTMQGWENVNSIDIGAIQK